MVDVSIDNASVLFEIKGTHQVWAMRKEIKIPFRHIREMRPDPNPPMGWWGAGLKLLGTDIPNRLKAGTFYANGGLEFWDVQHPEKTLVVELQNEKFKKLVIEVESPAGAIKLINDAIARRRSLDKRDRSRSS